MTVRKSYGKYIVDICVLLPSGEQIRKRKKSPIQTIRGAKEYERQLRNSILSGEFKAKKKTKEIPSLAEFSEIFLRHSKTNNKISSYESKVLIFEKHINPALGKKKINDISALDIENLKQLLADDKGHKPKTVNNTLTALKTALQCAVDFEIIEKIPKIRKLKVLKRKVEYLDPDEVVRLLAVAREEPSWYAFILLAVTSGMRLGELLALQWGDIDLKRKEVTIRRTNWHGHIGTPKSNAERIIPLTDLAVSALNKQRHLIGDFVWYYDDKNPIQEYHARAALKRIRRLSGLRHFGFHMLRHTFASICVMEGIPLPSVQELLGHASIEMTMVYAHLSPDAKTTAISILESKLISHGCIAASTKNCEKDKPEESRKVVNSLTTKEAYLARPEGFEPPTLGFEV